jgi:Fe-S-cluster-containing dehydrogenase component
MDDHNPSPKSIIKSSGLLSNSTRREFLRYSAGTTAAFSVVAAWIGLPAGAQVIITENADGILITDTTRCVGCRRCELACTEFNEGRAQPTLARIKVSRNYNFGPKGQKYGMSRNMGEYGNFLVVQDTCLQCPHPVPCATSCPHDAIVTDPKTRARVVDSEKCVGCRFCLKACPWEMIVFDEVSEKATKCFLCHGTPECVEACPASAVRYVAWRDLTRATPVRQALLRFSRDQQSAGCSPCH